MSTEALEAGGPNYECGGQEAYRQFFGMYAWRTPLRVIEGQIVAYEELLFKGGFHIDGLDDGKSFPSGRLIVRCTSNLSSEGDQAMYLVATTNGQQTVERPVARAYKRYEGKLDGVLDCYRQDREILCLQLPLDGYYSRLELNLHNKNGILRTEEGIGWLRYDPECDRGLQRPNVAGRLRSAGHLAVITDE